MEKHFLKLLSSFALTFTLGCSQQGVEAEPKGETSTVISGNLSENADKSQQGTGRLRYERTVSSSTTAIGLNVYAQLFDVNSSVEVIAYATLEPALSDGVHVTFLRKNDGLEVTVDNNGSGKRYVHPSLIARVGAVDNFSVRIDILPLATEPRMVMYPMNNASKGNYFFDSKRLTDLNLPLPAFPTRGVFLGANINNAKLKVEFASPIAQNSEIP